LKVLLTGTSLLPGYGGPAFSVSGLALALAEAGVKVGLWASDQSAVQTPLLPEASSVQRLIGKEAAALDQFGKPDILHDNGIWLPHNHRLAVLAQQRGIPRVISTRGMLEPWALSHKPLKKHLAWRLYQRRDLKWARRHHATSETEARNLRQLRLGVSVVTIPNGVDMPEERPSFVESEDGKAKQNGRRTALFLGRIYPVKGLPMLVKAWARLRPKGWQLRIVGPDEAGHRRQVEKAVSDAALGDVVTFTGPLDHRRKKSAFFGADLFVLPTYSESFGMAVAEALAHGVPVLTTTRSPWPGLAETGCGWSVDPTVDGIAEGLRQATMLNQEALRAMGKKGRALVIEKFSWKHVANLVLAMYETLRADASS
jgi:glycosyltransferase involved in cell wall biosynthesis